MGLIKTIYDSQMIPLTYHRVHNISNASHSHFSISIVQYMSKTDRERQKEDPSTPMYISSITFVKKYDNPEEDENLTIRQAYDWLKTLEYFEGAIDDFDDD